MNSRTFVFASPQKIFYKHAACCIFKNNIGNKSSMRWSLLFLERYIYISSSVCFFFLRCQFFLSRHQADHWMQQTKRGSLESDVSVSKRHHFKFKGSRWVTFPTLFIYGMLSYFVWKAKKKKETKLIHSWNKLIIYFGVCVPVAAGRRSSTPTDYSMTLNHDTYDVSLWTMSTAPDPWYILNLAALNSCTLTITIATLNNSQRELQLLGDMTDINSPAFANISRMWILVLMDLIPLWALKMCGFLW